MIVLELFCGTKSISSAFKERGHTVFTVDWEKGLVITFGELGHKRWKRLDYVSRYYGIESLEEFTLDALIEQVQAIGRRNKKELKVFVKKEWRNIGRVWFTIEPMKITEQWENKI